MLRLRPDYGPALEGAGEASFEMGNYRDARRYLTHAKQRRRSFALMHNRYSRRPVWFWRRIPWRLD